MRRLLCYALFLGLAGGTVQTVEAQVEIGAQGALASDVDFGIGGIVVFPLESVHEALEIAANFDFFFPDGFDYWEIGGLLRYVFPLEDVTVEPFVAAGLGIGRFSSGGTIFGEDISYDNTEVGLKVGGGAKIPSDTVTPFAEILLGIGDIVDFVLHVGVTFTVGG